MLTAQDQSIRDEILAQCLVDSKFMAQMFMSHAFYAPMSPLHDKFFDFVDNNPSKKKLIVATRGLGKTTIAQFFALKAILFSTRKFIGYLSKSSTAAQMCTNTIQTDLTTIPEIRKIFGDVSESKLEGLDDKWAQTSFVAHVAGNQTIVAPKGAKQQVRGMNWRHIRPDFWIIDDLEDDEEVNSEEQRKKLRAWFYGAFLFTVGQWENYDDHEMIYVDTIKHEDALLTYLMEDDDWDNLTLSICDENYKTRVPGFVSQEKLDKEVEGHRRRHTLDVFARERMCQPTSKEAAAFRQEYFQYYKEDDEDFRKRLPYIVNMLLFDPSKTKNPKNAQSAFVVWGLDLEHSMFYVRFAQGYYMSPKEMHDKFIDLMVLYKVTVAGVEVTGLEDHIMHPIKNEMIRRRLAGVPLITLNPKTGKGELTGEEGGKDGRIVSLLPYFERGLVKINVAHAGPLEQQLLSFPRSKKKDISDAAGYLGQALEKGSKYMNPPVAEDESIIDIEAEYACLDNEPPMQRAVLG